MDTSKRLLALLLAVTMLLSLAACGRAETAQPATQPVVGPQTETADTPAQEVMLQENAAPTEAEKEAAAETAAPEKQEVQETPEATTPVVELSASTLPVDDTDRESLEQIVQILNKDAGEGEDLGQMDDAQLEQLVTDLLEQGQTDEPQSSEPVVELVPEAYDENGAMEQPFDQVYPELIEQGKVEYDDETLLIKLENNTITDGMAAAGVAALEVIVPMEGIAWYEAKLLAGTDAQAALTALRELDEVILVEYNYQIRTAQIDGYKPYPGDKDFGRNEHEKDQWHMHHCGIPDGMGAMKEDGGSSSVVVAVIDTGVDYDHEDLAQNIWVNTKEIPDNNMDDDQNGYVDDYYGVNIVTGTGNGDDDNGHGTHVAGIIAAQNNNLGVVGLAYNVKIMPIKAAMASGYLHQSDIAKAVYYAYENGAEVINMSFGGTACSIAVQDALAVAYTRCVLVASAGNDGMPNEGLFAVPNYPAALTYVLGVMSVDSNGMESAFSNYDVKAFNGVEYEVYAPGENIMSTLPNDRYGLLSGTSMAAPLVSAMAAILRGEFSDRDKYPTKFIYGQLASTSNYTATCLNPEYHGLHNLPQIVDLHAALTKIPRPEVNMQDYAIFDTEGFQQDTADKNNGDGAIDAGETIALGLTLRNRWGMSENTMVKLDTLSMAGIPDPYITILNDTADYGSVGTYSTQDCGRIYTDELLTGWKDPFYIHIADNCPNDYIFRVNVTVSCENALDENDHNTYVTTNTIFLEVRNGTVLPKVISEDMVLTPENLYIIADSTIIEKGVTVRVEPGTHIQFWSNDRDDPYADNYIAYLRVEGQFLVEGTKENPVYIYPSDLMSNYVVELGTANGGVVALNYADVTNYACPGGNVGIITSVYGCVFRKNFGGYLGHRYLSNGKVQDSNCGVGLSFGSVRDTAFYKIGNPHDAAYVHNGSFERCIFVDTAIDVNNRDCRNCVFLGNNFQDQTNSNYIIASGATVEPLRFSGVSSKDLSIFYRPETGTSYVVVLNAMQHMEGEHQEEWKLSVGEYIREMGGDWIVAETEDEIAWLRNNLSFYTDYYEPAETHRNYFYYDLGISYDYSVNKYVWNDGTAVEAMEIPQDWDQRYTPYLYKNTLKMMHERPDDPGTDGYYLRTMCLFEIPGPVYLTDFTLPEYEILLDMDAVYQLDVSSKPINVDPETLFFESRNEEVVTVSATGLITPVGLGETEVYVYSDDRALSTYITVTVKDYVALEALALPMEQAELAVGENLTLECDLLPADTTRRHVTYTSSDPSVATVDRYGKITGISSGEVIITVSSAEPDSEGNPISASLALKVYNKATSLSVDVITMIGMFTQPVDETEEGINVLDLPGVICSDGAEMILSWRCVDPTVADVEDGKLVLKKLGTTTLEVKDLRSGLSASCLVIVQNEKLAAIKKIEVEDSVHCVLLEDGRMYYWSASQAKPVCKEGVKDFDTFNDVVVILRDDGTLVSWGPRYTDGIISTDFVGTNVTCIDRYNNNYFCVADGNAYTWGTNNNYGQLGVGFIGDVDTPALVNLENVVDIVTTYQTTYFLTAEGKLYYSGGDDNCGVMEPTLIAENIDRLMENAADSYNIRVVTKDGKCFNQYANGSTSDKYTAFSHMDKVVCSNNSVMGLLDGQVYVEDWYGSDNIPKTIPGIDNAVDIYIVNETYYVMTADNLLLAYGGNPSSYYHMMGISAENYVEFPVVVPFQGLAEESLSIVETNLVNENQVLYENELVITFNKEIKNATVKLYRNGNQVTEKHRIEDLNKLVISRTSGFEDEHDYRVVIVKETLVAAAGIKNTEDIVLEFRYFDMGTGDGEVNPDMPTGPVVHPAVLDESVERFYWTTELVAQTVNSLREELNLNPNFIDNAILNRLSTDTEVSHWLRVLAREKSYSDGYPYIPLGRNYWGSTNERAIGLQILDYSDYPTYMKIEHTPYLTEAPEDTFPFVTSVQIIDKNGEAITTVGNEKVTFRVTFNRDMDTSIPLTFRFGSAYPYGDYEVFGEYVDARTWEGEYMLTTVIENGYQYFSISEGCTADGQLDLWPDVARFFFELDTTAAQALIMQGNATDTGIQLSWTQDDFDTLMGYNVYRSTSEDGYYDRINNVVIDADTKEFFDATVEPGVIYYYNFTVVKTDLTESIPSGKIAVMSKDTMAPDIYHSPVTNASTGSNLVVSATVTDNLMIHSATLYYRQVGTAKWTAVVMNKLNDKYSAIIPADSLTTAGLEYYLEAFDGNSYTYKGSASAPYTITVRQAMDANARGDVNGDGVISNLDALMILQAINDLLNLSAAQFERADLNGDKTLEPAEALRILQYISGSVGSLQMK